MIKYRRLDETLVSPWAKSLIEKKGSGIQREFLSCVLDSSANEFVDFVEKSIGITSESAYKNQDGETLTLLNLSGQPIISMTAGHMYLMPANDIRQLYDHWKDIPYEEAACPTLWGAITLAEIKAERIRPIWLAVDHKCREEEARKGIEKALREQDKKNIDDLTRRCLRWMTAPGTMRGAPELYGNCSLAKAWWCGYFSHEASQLLEVEVEEVIRSLQKIWLGLTDYLAGKLTVIGEPNVIAGISLWARSHIRQGTRLTRTQAEQTCRMLGEMSSWCALGLVPAPEIERMILNYTPVVDYREEEPSKP